jgi:DNA-directed RNA polymerase specialized sigma24 family protein
LLRERRGSDDPAIVQERLARLEVLESTLWRLRPAERQIIYMRTLAGLPTATLMRRLRFKDKATVYRRLHAARAALRAFLPSEGSARENDEPD